MVADEVFLVLDGELTIHLRDGDVRVKPGEMYVVPKGFEHKPEAVRECQMMLVEPAGTTNAGDVGGARTTEGSWL